VDGGVIIHIGGNQPWPNHKEQDQHLLLPASAKGASGYGLRRFQRLGHAVYSFPEEEVFIMLPFAAHREEAFLL
jgi:hypothetical protein